MNELKTFGIAKAPIKNFHQVTSYLYRGGQPGHEGFNWLAENGIKTVVSFRWGAKINQAERKAVEAAGMKYISMPLNYWNLPTQAVIDSFLVLVDEEQNHPMYVHCLHGADRTGVLVATFRMARMNWTVDEAYKEMKACGFHRFRLRHFKWILYQYARRAVQGQVGI